MLVDIATLKKTKSCYSREKVKVDLLGKFLTKINVEIIKKSAKIKEKWVTIKYDYVPILQGHDEKGRFIIHPKLVPKKMARGGEEPNNEKKEEQERNVNNKEKEDNEEEEEEKSRCNKRQQKVATREQGFSIPKNKFFL